MNKITLKINCPDRPGLIATITQFIFQNNGNILDLSQHSDINYNRFFMRIEWDLTNFKIPRQNIKEKLAQFLLENNIRGKWDIFLSDQKPRLALFVSKYDHCLWDILLRHQSGELNCEIPLIISNHSDLKHIAQAFNIHFAHVGINGQSKENAEKKELELLKKHQIDFIGLARYMQILSPYLLQEYENKIINIHHSFLPAFKGAKPYAQAHKRGVKVIGATAHFANEKLDQGPIITQNIIHISHKDNVTDLVIKGRNIEKTVFAEAIKLFTENRIFVYDKRTIIL